MFIAFYFFFFQAEDGIRDIGVTGVQTCALPISPAGGRRAHRREPDPPARPPAHRLLRDRLPRAVGDRDGAGAVRGGRARAVPGPAGGGGRPKGPPGGTSPGD